MAKGHWTHSKVIYGLLHRPGVLDRWRAIVREEYSKLGLSEGEKLFFSWNEELTGRTQGFIEGYCDGKLQDFLEFADPKTDDTFALAHMAFSKADKFTNPHHYISNSIADPSASLAGCQKPLPLPPPSPPSPPPAVVSTSSTPLTGNFTANGEEASAVVEVGQHVAFLSDNTTLAESVGLDLDRFQIGMNEAPGNILQSLSRRDSNSEGPSPGPPFPAVSSEEIWSGFETNDPGADTMDVSMPYFSDLSNTGDEIDSSLDDYFQHNYFS